MFLCTRAGTLAHRGVRLWRHEAYRSSASRRSRVIQTRARSAIAVSDAVLEPRGEDSGETGTVSAALALDVQERNLPITGLGTTTDWVGESTGGTGGLSSPAPAESSAARSPPPRRARSEVVVLLPALNEEQSVGRVIDRIPTDRLRSLGYDVAVWVVDGQSVDQTMEVARARGASTFVQTGNGKGNGMRQALNHLLVRTHSG